VARVADLLAGDAELFQGCRGHAVGKQAEQQVFGARLGQSV
jgi:hypothetical protein